MSRLAIYMLYWYTGETDNLLLEEHFLQIFESFFFSDLLPSWWEICLLKITNSGDLFVMLREQMLPISLGLSVGFWPDCPVRDISGNILVFPTIWKTVSHTFNIKVIELTSEHLHGRSMNYLWQLQRNRFWNRVVYFLYNANQTSPVFCEVQWCAYAWFHHIRNHLNRKHHKGSTAPCNRIFVL